MDIPLTLGELIRKLEQYELDNPVVYDFCRAKPTEFGSWRGSYNQLALGHIDSAHPSNPLTVEALLRKAKECIGQTFYGYKGGEYTMSANTWVWVDNHGESTCTAIVDVQLIDDWLVMLVTKYLDYSSL